MCTRNNDNNNNNTSDIKYYRHVILIYYHNDAMTSPLKPYTEWWTRIHDLSAYKQQYYRRPGQCVQEIYTKPYCRYIMYVP